MDDEITREINMRPKKIQYSTSAPYWSTGVLIKCIYVSPNELENVSDSEMHTYALAVSSVIKYVLTSKLIYSVHQGENNFSMKAEANLPQEMR